MINLRTRPQVCSPVDGSVVWLRLLREEHELAVVVLVGDDDGVLRGLVDHRLEGSDPGPSFEGHQLRVGVFTG